MKSPEKKHDPVRTWTDESLPMETRRELLAREVDGLRRRRQERPKSSDQPPRDQDTTGSHPG